MGKKIEKQPRVKLEHSEPQAESSTAKPHP